MQDISIRQATTDELPILLEFEQGIVQAERPFDSQLKDGQINYYDIRKLIVSDDAQVLVAEANGKLVGSGYAKIRESKPYLKHPRHTYLGFMYIAPEFRGKRINKMIIDGLVEWSRSKNIYEIRLDVYDENDMAIRAYQKAGFNKNLVEMRMHIEK